MPYPAVAVANAFIDIGKQNNANDLTPMKLQKLVYFAHGWNLGATGAPLINEQVEAWRYGPVVRSIYEVAKQFGNSHIGSYLSTMVLTPDGNWVMVPQLLGEQESQGVKPLLNWIWSQYGHYSGIQLSNMTHEPETPWKKTVDETPGFLSLNKDIDTDIIKDYFSQKLRSLTSAQA